MLLFPINVEIVKKLIHGTPQERCTWQNRHVCYTVLRSTWCPVRRGTVCVPCFEGTLLLRTVLTRPAKSGQFSNVIDSGSSSTAVLQQIKEIFQFYQFQSLMSNSTKIGYRFSLRSWEDPERVEINNPSIEEVRHRIIALLVAGRHIMAPQKANTILDNDDELAYMSKMRK